MVVIQVKVRIKVFRKDFGSTISSTGGSGISEKEGKSEKSFLGS